MIHLISGKQQISKKRLQDKAQLGWKGNPLEIVKEIKFGHTNQMVFAQTRINPSE